MRKRIHIVVDQELFDFIKSKAKPHEYTGDILRRLFKLPLLERKKGGRPPIENSEKVK